MVRLKWTSALALFFTAIPSTASIADDAAIKREIQAKYQAMADSIRHKDPSAMMKCLAPDFTNVDEHGNKSGRAQFEKQMAQMMSTIKRVDRISFDVAKLTVKGSEAVADCHSKFLMQTVDTQGTMGPKGRHHQIEADMVDKETWVKSGKTWLLKSSATQAGGKFLVDGKAQSAQQQPAKM